MKRCPQCGAEYDDYVQYCFVDGAELGDAASVPAPPTPPAAPPPSVPAVTPPPKAGPPPVPSQLAIPASTVPRTVSPPPLMQPATAAAGGGLPMWAVVMVLMMLVAAFGFVSLAGALLLIGGSGEAGKPPADVTARPLPPPPTPVPTPPQPQSTRIIQVDFDSDPPGAMIFEEEKELCVTPCRVPHPEYAPDKRTFVLKLEGHPDTTYEMTDPNEAQLVKLQGRGPRPSSRKKLDGDDIIIER